MADQEPHRGQPGPDSTYSRMPRLESVREDLEPIEALEGEIDDLTEELHDSLPPRQFRLVWALRDDVERLGLAEELLRERPDVTASSTDALDPPEPA